MKPARALISALLLLTVLPRPLSAEAAAATSEIRIYDAENKLLSSFKPFPEENGSAGSITVADLGTDGTSEIIVGTGPGGQPLVRVFRQDGSKIGEFLAYDAKFNRGVTVTACDLNNDGTSEIITGVLLGGGPHVRVFDSMGTFTGLQFFAYDGAFRGGVNVACGDVDGDGKMEIVTGAGVTGGPHIKIFSANGILENERFIDSANTNIGASVWTANIDADPEEEILASPMAYGNYDVSVLDYTHGKFAHSFKETGRSTSVFGSSVTSVHGKLAVTNGAYSSPEVKFLDSDKAAFTPFDGSTGYATLLAAIHDGDEDTLVTLSSPTALSSDPSARSIIVDISEQRLYAYENGIEVKSFLVSTGKDGYNTPQGKTTVTAKIPVMTYAWTYGAGDPRNYSLPNVKWNMRFRNHYYIHSAYWHNNFGQRMSHGCVNTSIPDAEWIYAWASVGTAVEVRQ